MRLIASVRWKTRTGWWRPRLEEKEIAIVLFRSCSEDDDRAATYRGFGLWEAIARESPRWGIQLCLHYDLDGNHCRREVELAAAAANLVSLEVRIEQS
jgi:hypothetical protein